MPKGSVKEFLSAKNIEPKLGLGIAFRTMDISRKLYLAKVNSRDCKEYSKKGLMTHVILLLVEFCVYSPSIFFFNVILLINSFY